MNAVEVDGPDYRALIKDIFLLPELANKNLITPFTTDLPKLLICALQSSESLFPEECKGQLRQCRNSIYNFLDARAGTNQTDKEGVFELLQSKCAAAIPLYLRHHNAGIIIRWGQRHRRIEAFQLSPKVQAVETVGRLRRQFPEISVVIQEATAANEDFIEVFAETMAEIDETEVSGLKPTRSIKGKKYEVQYEATQPDHLFDAIFGFLFTEQSSDKDVPAHAKIVKHTRDFVLHVENETTAIRRSPIWLLLKVVLQQELRHSKAMSDYTLYKQFMVFFFALLLDSACDRNLDSHTLHCMRRKIGYRMWKLQDKAVGPWIKNVQHALAKVNGLLNTRWDKIVKRDQGLQATTLPQFLADATDCTVTHRELDTFLAKVSQTPPQTTNAVADPRSDIISWGPGKLPNMKELGDAESHSTNIFNLIMVETWVEDYLWDFIRSQEKDECTCSDIRSFAIAYFDRAHVVYKDLPDHMSVMYLTLLELWIASDMSAVARNPLLRDYTPFGVEDICWEALILQRRRDVSRLSRAEEYIISRSLEKMSMIANYGTADCFASRFVKASAPHLALRVTIVCDEDRNVEEKATELENIIRKHKWHLESHEKMQCDPSTCRIGTGQILCERCSHLVLARELTITPFIEILPEDEDVANAVLFELEPPADVSAWRDFGLFLQLNVAGHSNPGGTPAFYSYLHNYKLFEPYAEKNALNSDPRICMASRPPKKGTNDPIQVRQDLKLSEICVPHPMKWRLFDSDQSKFVKNFEKESLISDTCCIMIDEGNRILQKLCCSSASDTDALTTANDLITMRLEYENTIVLKHNEELGSLYLCHYATWPKILRELRGTSIDWTAPETFSVILQVALEAGPKQESSELRQRHAHLRDGAFATEILDEILRVLDIYTASFSGRTALAVFCTITIKILSEAPDPCHAKAYHILNIIRNTCFEWLRDRRINVLDVTSTLLATQLDLALICVYTFNLSNRALKHVLTSPAKDHGEQYVLASTIIQESKSRLTTQFQKSLYSSWLRVAVNAAPILCGQVNRGELGSITNGLHFSLGRATGLLPDENCFSHVSGPWIRTRTAPYPEMVCKIIHLNTMTGEILLDGFSPRHLSANFLAHRDFRALFGRMSPAVTPRNHPIYQYQFHHAFKGFVIEIGLEKVTSAQKADEVESLLHLRATKGDLVYVLVPRQILSKTGFPFPKEYLNGYFHWHQITDFSFHVDLYPYQSPWDSGSIAMQLLHQRSGAWLLKQHGRERVVMPATVTHYEELSKIFQHFKTENDFRVILDQEKKTLEVRLGTLGLNFFVVHGSADIRSVEFENMSIDHEYSPPTLIGLLPKLILYNRHIHTHRVLVILDGEETVLKASEHVDIDIEIKEETTIQVYTIDDFLGQLKGNQTWRSKAWLAYLSALTSHPMPDPFTSRTGQETALEILTSSAMTSFDALEAKDIALLQKIGQLSPGIQFRKRGGLNIPTIEWNPKLHPASHHEKYWLAVEKIRDSADRLDLFKKDSTNQQRKTPEAETRYRESYAIRLACLRTGEYDGHTTDHDADYYFRMPGPEPKRKKCTMAAVSEKFDYGSSSGFKRAYYAAFGAKYRQRFKPVIASPGSILGQMTIAGTIKGVTIHYDAQNFRYTPKWASTAESTLVEDLCSVHNALSRSIQDRNAFRLRLWLSTVAYGMEGPEDSIVMPILIALVNENHKTGLEIPTTSNVNYGRGTEYSADQIVMVLNEAKCMHQSSPLAIDAQTLQSREKFKQTQDKIISSLAERIAKNGLIDLSPHLAFLNVVPATESIRELLKIWNLNKKWHKYAEHLCERVLSLEVGDTKPPAVLHVLPKVDKSSATTRMSGHITIESIMGQSPEKFSSSNEWRAEFVLGLKSLLQMGKCSIQPALLSMPTTLYKKATKQHENIYIKELDASIHALKTHDYIEQAIPQYGVINALAKAYNGKIEARLQARLLEAHAAVTRVTGPNASFYNAIRCSDILPHISLSWLLRRLSFSNKNALSSGWSSLIRQIAWLCRDRQHMHRIMKACSTKSDILNELRTIERFSYDDSLFPDAVLLEIEQDICLRSNQLEIARQMRNHPRGENAVMQLNMGEGKSSMIIPILSACLAQGKTLVRVFAGRHQSKQMLDTLITAMSGLMDRPVFRMPFNRDSKLSPKSILKVKESLSDCANNGGVLLLQPEHHLSLLLSTSLNDEPAATRNYVSLLKYIKTTSRDIIDECDELLSPTYELLYTIGTPGPVDFAPDRWLFIQGLLEYLKDYSNPKSGIITTDQVLYQSNPEQPDAFPSFCFLTPASLCAVLTEVARKFVIEGITGFPASRCPGRMKKAVFEYITMPEVPEKTVKKVETLGEAAISGLALVRGCIAGDVLRVPLLRKRWRVDYGCDFRRKPPTRLAVPFSAKDVPKPRAEFSNTDVVILFTQLSYYHSGLYEEHVRDLIEYMLTSDDGHDIYGHWFENSMMPSQLQTLKAVNLQDDKQFHELFFPNIRYSIKAINHFLRRLVFPTELGAFSRHMAASGWDLAEVKAHPTTGFSGTTDQCELLPLDMKKLNLPTQAHTNALVLNNILSAENTVLLVYTELEKRSFDGSDLIDHVIRDGKIRVLLDVGAQVIKLSNRQVAERWLHQTQDSTIQAVVFCDDTDALSVIDRSGTALPLKVSIYANKLDACAVFLDEAHTRGTDLRLPPNYRAAVTLGPGLTKDRLAQACMRMRNLGNGQTLVFYVSFEVENSIRSLLHLSEEQSLTIDYIIQWSILQTQSSITRQIPNWAKQGRRHGEQAEAWGSVFSIKHPTATKYEGIQELFVRKGYGISKSSSGGIDETCEREVAPEIEDEKQVSQPPKPAAMESFHNKALEKFIETGEIDDELPRLEWAFQSLDRTTLGNMLNKLKFPRTLRVTKDFAQAVDTDDPTDAYQHHVAYVLHIKPALARHGDPPAVIIITQSDLENNWSAIEKSKMVDLHLYNAKVTPQAARRVHYIYPLNIACSYTHPTTTRIALDLFAGQLYFGSYHEYIEVSSFLGLAYFDNAKEMGIEADLDGFIPSHERHKIPAWHRHANQYWDTFDVSPVPFLKRFLGVVRSHGAGIEHTHIGRILDGERLGSKDFPDFKARGPEDVEPGVETERRTRIETKAQRDQRMQMQGKRRREDEPESKAGPALKRSRSAASEAT
ncbi:hypothetical protein G3M48_002566 [Beauveria asiatica]|uniref:ubiquitinyl hydrolase 1 n=1 Tax=Beauveria asiatica TaxID=1069075 RepID=A0AAW0RY95_9HYPO